jgi:hypothetical protein
MLHDDLEFSIQGLEKSLNLSILLDRILSLFESVGRLSLDFDVYVLHIWE